MTIIFTLRRKFVSKRNYYFELNLLQERQTEPMGEIRTLENVNHNVLGIDNKAVERNAERQPDIQDFRKAHLKKYKTN